MSVAYLGPPGTFSEEALEQWPAIREMPRFPFSTLEAVYESVLAGEVELGVLPIESSAEGAVGTTLDLFVHRPGLSIRGESVLDVEHHLLASLETVEGHVQRVLSHPQALAQCSGFLRHYMPQATLEPAPSTADAARLVATQPGSAAIASRVAAEKYGLAIVVQGIQDRAANRTRFVLAGRSDCEPTGLDKTSIAFTLDRDQPGGLWEVLGEFASRNLNLSRVESRPDKEALGHYIFFVDFEGHRMDGPAAQALALVRQRSHRFYMLGSYPRYTVAA